MLVGWCLGFAFSLWLMLVWWWLADCVFGLVILVGFGLVGVWSVPGFLCVVVVD